MNTVKNIFDNSVNILIKTAEQIEFAEIFERLEKGFNFSKADVARALNLERSYISMLIKGNRNPAQRTLQDMRSLEARLKKSREQGEQIIDSKDDLNRLFDHLKMMEKNDRPNFEVAKKVIESLSPINSTVDAAAKRLLTKAVASEMKHGPK